MKQSIKALLLSASFLASGISNVVAQQAYFTGLYGFGDSLTDNGRIPREDPRYTYAFPPAPAGSSPSGSIDAAYYSKVYEGGRWSNAAGYFEQIPGRVGAPYNPYNDYAVGGAQSIHEIANSYNSPTFDWGVPDQIDQFAARVGQFAPRDIALLWIGYNDLSLISTTATAEVRNAGVSQILANNVTALNRLVGLGARNLLVFNQQTFRLYNQDLAATFNAQLPGALQAFSNQGINVHYFDVNGLLNRLRANPTAFGYIPEAATGNCFADLSCRYIGYLYGGAPENQYISVDGTHLTGKTNTFIAAFVANQLNAPLTIGPQGDLAETSGLAFSSTLIDFMGSERRHDGGIVSGRSAASSTTPIGPGSSFSVFVLGTYVSAERTAQPGIGSTGNTYGADLGGVTAGAVYQATPFLKLGAAFNYLSTSVNLGGLSNGRINLDSLQGGGFASLSLPHFFADTAVTFGGNSFDVSRPDATGDRLNASPAGDTVTVATRIGYLYDFERFRIGPIGEVAYGRATVASYNESGDTLLTIGTQRQTLQGLTAGGGVQVTSDIPIMGGVATPFANLTAQHDFIDGVRTVTSFQTYAPTLLIRTQTGRPGDDVFGRFAGGLDLDLGHHISGLVAGSTSFARSGGDDRTVSAGMKYQF